MFFSAVHQGGCGGRRYVCGERGYVHLYVGVYGAKGQPQVLFLRSCPFLEKKIIPFTLILFVCLSCAHALQYVQRSEDHLWELVLSFHYVSPRD